MMNEVSISFLNSHASLLSTIISHNVKYYFWGRENRLSHLNFWIWDLEFPEQEIYAVKSDHVTCFFGAKPELILDNPLLIKKVNC